jgi:hypothetical protein
LTGGINIDVEKWIEQRTILKVYRGSHAYGTNHKDSDIDLGGICIPPKDYIVGFHKFDQWENKNYINFHSYNKSRKSAEIVIYGLYKFFNLAFNCNPNIIEHIFVDPTHILQCNEYGKLLIDNRRLFLTKRARHTFGGYAFGQLKRLTNKLPMNEAKKKIENINNKINEYQVYITKIEHKKDLFKNKEIDDNEALLLLGIKNEIIEYNTRINNLTKEKNDIENLIGGGNHNHHGSHKDIIDKYQWDTKHGSHLIRLLHMGLEILTEGECYVLRPDNNYLLAIRHGDYTLEYIQKEADRLFKLLDDAYINSKLPNAPDIEKVNKLLCEMTFKSFTEDW